MHRFLHRIRHGVGVLVFNALVAVQLLSQPACAQFSRFQNYADEQGLGDLGVTSIAQDRDGYMLFGTQGGLYRYNGQIIMPFDAAFGLPDANWIRKVLCDTAGRTWVMTATNLYVRRQGRFQPVDLGVKRFSADGPHLMAVTSSRVVVDSGGELRQASLGGDAVGSFAPIFTGPVTNAAPWTAKAGFVVADRDGGLLFGCGQALCQLSSAGRPSVMGVDMGLPADAWQTALATSDGTLWVRSLGRLASLKRGDRTFDVMAIPGRHNTFFSGHMVELELIENQKQGILTQGDDGYLEWNGTVWHAHPHHVGGVPDSMIAAFQFSHGGSLWLGSLGNGVFRSQGLGQWEHWTKEDGLPATTVWSIARLPDGRLWVATGGGTAPLDRSSMVIPNTNYVLATTRRGRLWTAPFGASLTRFDPIRQGLSYFPSVGVVESAVVDRNNRLWLATRDTVLMLPDADADLSSARMQRVGSISGVLDFNTDQTGTTWIASPDGVFRWRADTGLSRVLPPDALTGSPFSAIFTPTGELWLATQTAGILRFARKGDGFRPLSPVVEPALASKDVLFLHRDHLGRIWVGTDRGIDVFDGSSWQRFTSAQGPISNDLSQQALYEDPDGSMWFGSSQGLSHLLDADHLPPPRTPRAPLITGLSLGTRQIALRPRVTVPWIQGPLEIRFDDLSYSVGQNMRFRYRLKGVDSGWNETAERVIRYSGPPAGRLTFILVAVDTIHRTSSVPATLDVHILAPWWQWPAFRWSSAAALTMLLVVACRMRMRVLLRRQADEASYKHSVREQQRLEEMVTARTAEIGAARDLLEQQAQELKQQASELQRLAMSDVLTGLPNRRAVMLALEDRLRDALHTEQPLAVLLCDIDHFKSVNDHYGHQVGDRVLSLFGERLGCAIATDESAGRYGGEEFLVVLRGDAAELVRRTNEIRAAVTGTPYPLDETQHKVTASGGLAFLRPTDTAATLIARADLALYQAKENGRDRIEPERDETVASREAELKRDLRAAPSRGEFELHFQPVVDVTRNVITSCEALLRWDSPVRGSVSPGDFIPFAEQHGLMAGIDAWVLRTACREAVGWSDSIRVSVNLSSSHFHQHGLVELISDVLAETGLPPGRLELEVTETAMIADVSAAAAVLGRLRALGISIALDDFGTGYSSLSFLRTLPFDRIKIDRSFVRDLGIEPEAAAIIGGVIHLCTGMGAAVTAEGVETPQQIDLLCAIGCREIQGFGIGVPAPARQIRAWIAAFGGNRVVVNDVTRQHPRYAEASCADF